MSVMEDIDELCGKTQLLTLAGSGQSNTFFPLPVAVIGRTITNRPILMKKIPPPPPCLITSASTQTNPVTLQIDVVPLPKNRNISWLHSAGNW